MYLRISSGWPCASVCAKLVLDGSVLLLAGLRIFCCATLVCLCLRYASCGWLCASVAPRWFASVCATLVLDGSVLLFAGLRLFCCATLACVCASMLWTAPVSAAVRRHRSVSRCDGAASSWCRLLP